MTTRDNYAQRTVKTNSAVQLLSMVVQRGDLIDLIRGREDSCMMLVSVFLYDVILINVSTGKPPLSGLRSTGQLSR